MKKMDKYMKWILKKKTIKSQKGEFVRKANVLLLAIFLCFAMFPSLIVHAADVTVTHEYDSDMAVTGSKWIDSEVISTGAYRVDASYNIEVIRAKPGYYYVGMSFDPAIPTPNGSVSKLGRGEKITNGQLTQDTKATYLFVESNVQYAYSSTEEPEGFSWDEYRPDDSYVDPNVIVFLKNPATTKSTKNGTKQGTWEFKWTAVDEEGEVPIVYKNEHYRIVKGNSTITVTGSWTFTEDEKYSLTYVFDTPVPSEYTPALLEPQDVYVGTKVTLDPRSFNSDFEIIEDDGTHYYEFNGWKKALCDEDEVPIVGGNITMPDGPVVVHGSWIWTVVTYSFEKPNPEYTGGDYKLSAIKRSHDDEHTFGLFTDGGTVSVDGNKIDPSNYVAESGSLQLTLKESYIKKLGAGTHTITVDFFDGVAKGTFEIPGVSKPKPVIPKTGIE